MKKAFAYYRKSIEREAEKSIEGQREEVRRYAGENNIEIVEEFSEVASSASLDRAEFQRMLTELGKRKDIDFILVYMFDRISREVKHMGYIMTLLDNTKARLHSCTEDNDYEGDPTKLMLIMMKTYGATMERIAIYNRMQDGKRRKQEKGGYLGGKPPFGYQTAKGTGRLVANPDEVPTVREAFFLRKKGLTMSEIADELNRRGFQTREGKKFYAMTVQRMLKHKDWYQGNGEAPKIL